jgi:hypothetical protein
LGFLVGLREGGGGGLEDPTQGRDTPAPGDLGQSNLGEMDEGVPLVVGVLQKVGGEEENGVVTYQSTFPIRVIQLFTK